MHMNFYFLISKHRLLYHKLVVSAIALLVVQT